LNPSRPYRWCFHRHACRARRQIEFERDQFRRAELVNIRPDAEDAVAQAALQRAERLPFCSAIVPVLLKNETREK